MLQATKHTESAHITTLAQSSQLCVARGMLWCGMCVYCALGLAKRMNERNRPTKRRNDSREYAKKKKQTECRKIKRAESERNVRNE